MNKNLICIVCPKGCRVNLISDETAERGYKVEGATCKRGVNYAIEEMTDPRRKIPTTVKIKNGTLNRLPVITAQPVPKHLIFECMAIINTIEVTAPIKVNQVVYENILGLGVDIIATRSMGLHQE